MLVLDENDSFNMQAYVEAPGYQRIVLSGYLTKQQGNKTYIHSLLPQMFYGASGNALSTWRQNLTTTGNQTILSRSGGLPKVSGLIWKEVKSPSQTATRSYEDAPPINDIPFNPLIIAPIVIIGVGTLLWYLFK